MAPKRKRAGTASSATEPAAESNVQASSRDASAEDTTDAILDDVKERKQMEPPAKRTRGVRSASTSNRKGLSLKVDMPADGAIEGGDSISGDESNGVGGKNEKKNRKKTQRFYCVDFPPCNLSFTRSEHLERHIRYVILLSALP